jgi:hypothetical protein
VRDGEGYGAVVLPWVDESTPEVMPAEARSRAVDSGSVGRCSVRLIAILPGSSKVQDNPGPADHVESSEHLLQWSQCGRGHQHLPGLR